jgi:hypothetical protein
MSNDNSFTINGDDKVFEGSEFEGGKFSIKIKPLTKTQLRTIRKECTSGRGNLDDLAFGTKIFIESVIDWDIKDENGNLVICDEKNKKFIDERFPKFSGVVSSAALDSFRKDEDLFKEEVKN